jgi:hypothetical protein
MNQSDPTFSEFYADYLAHHRHPWNRALHLAAKLLALAALAAAVYERSVLLLLAAPILAVAPCWIGHLLIEGDRPVSWTQPAASLLGSLGRICGIGGIGGIAATGTGGRPPRPPGVRPYYSFAADLRMCAAMLGLPARLATPATLATPSTPSSGVKPGASSEPT